MISGDRGNFWRLQRQSIKSSRQQNVNPRQNLLFPIPHQAHHITLGLSLHQRTIPMFEESGKKWKVLSGPINVIVSFMTLKNITTLSFCLFSYCWFVSNRFLLDFTYFEREILIVSQNFFDICYANVCIPCNILKYEDFSIFSYRRWKRFLI